MFGPQFYSKTDQRKMNSSLIKYVHNLYLLKVALSVELFYIKVESDIFPSLLPAARTTCPDCPCAPGDSNGEFKPGLDHHMDGFNVEQMKIPENIPEDSADRKIIFGTANPKYKFKIL